MTALIMHQFLTECNLMEELGFMMPPGKVLLAETDEKRVMGLMDV
jgi:hypothetical protein